jgi:hypothetical protein
LDPLLAPLIGLPASVVTKPLVAPALSAFGCEEAGALAAKPVSSADHQRLEEAGYRPKISFGERVIWERQLMAILTHASWNTFYSAALIRLFSARSVLGSYLNPTIAAGALALVLVVLTRGRLPYPPEAA